MAWIRSQQYKIAANVGIAALGIPFATTNIFPYSIISLFITDPSQQGLFMGAMNVFISLPQVVDTQITGRISEHFKTSKVGGEWAVLFLGSGLAALGAVATLFLILKKEEVLSDPLLASARQSRSSKTDNLDDGLLDVDGVESRTSLN